MVSSFGFKLVFLYKFILSIYVYYIGSFQVTCSPLSGPPTLPIRLPKHTDEEDGFGQEGIPLKRQDSLRSQGDICIPLFIFFGSPSSLFFSHGTGKPFLPPKFICSILLLLLRRDHTPIVFYGLLCSESNKWFFYQSFYSNENLQNYMQLVDS